jgi:DNA-binding transcriptional ArsR family regulator
MRINVDTETEPTGQLRPESVEAAELRRSASEASALLRAMANECRLLILCHLVERERSVTELEQLVGLSQSALSQHLALLRSQNLVKVRRESRLRHYSIASPQALAVMKTLYDEFCNPARNSAESACVETLDS